MTTTRLLRKAPYVTDARVLEVLDAMETPNGMQAASHLKLAGSIVGRDSFEIGLDVIDHQAARVQRILINAARLIGRRTDRDSEEEEGKIFHEHRSLVVGGQHVDPTVEEIFAFLSPRWGGNDEEFTYYGAIDSTALYLVLLDEYVHRHGDSLLWAEFVHRRSGETMRMVETVVMAAEFYMRRIEDSRLGLVENVRLNKQYGFWYQVMREYSDAVTLPDGSLPNIDAKMAFFEVQTLVARSLRSAARLVKDRNLVERWRAGADLLTDSALQNFWDAERRRFARAIHRDINGEPELIFMNDSALAETLRDDPFVHCAEHDRQAYVTSIIEPLYRTMLSDVGFRMQSVEHAANADYYSYGGPFAAFPVITKRIAEGFYRYNLAELGVDADQRMLSGLETVRGFPDVHFVDLGGRVILPADGDEVPGTADIISATTKPMVHQGWTASAAWAALHRMPRPRARSRWQTELVERIEGGLWEDYERRLNLPEEARKPRRQWFDQVSGLQKEEQISNKSGRLRNSAIVPINSRRRKPE